MDLPFPTLAVHLESWLTEPGPPAERPALTALRRLLNEQRERLVNGWHKTIEGWPTRLRLALGVVCLLVEDPLAETIPLAEILATTPADRLGEAQTFFEQFGTAVSSPWLGQALRHPGHGAELAAWMLAEGCASLPLGDLGPIVTSRLWTPEGRRNLLCLVPMVIRDEAIRLLQDLRPTLAGPMEAQVADLLGLLGTPSLIHPARPCPQASPAAPPAPPGPIATPDTGTPTSETDAPTTVASEPPLPGQDPSPPTRPTAAPAAPDGTASPPSPPGPPGPTDLGPALATVQALQPDLKPASPTAPSGPPSPAPAPARPCSAAEQPLPGIDLPPLAVATRASTSRGGERATSASSARHPLFLAQRPPPRAKTPTAAPPRSLTERLAAALSNIYLLLGLAGAAVALATFVLIRWNATPTEAPRALKPGERVWIDAVTRRPITESFLMADKEFRMGEIFRIQNRFNDAQSFYRAAVSIDPTHVEAIDRLGYCLYKLQSYEAAEAQFRKALAIEPGFYRSHFYLGRLHKRAQRWTEALAAYRQAFAARKDLTQIGIEYLDLLLRLGLFEEARPLAAELVQRFPTNREIAELQARLLREAP